ncbi:MAG: MmcQ/YjbR family DNA-binding protein [Streptosporangiaceae bacterium]
MTSLDEARRLALALPEAGEQPHFDMTSFRVRGKIFATAPPGGGWLNVFLDEDEASAYVAEDPAAFQPLYWGQRHRGLRVELAACPAGRLAEVLAEAWRRKAPKRLAAGFDQAG